MLNKNVDPVNNLTKIKNPPPPFASPPCHYPLPLPLSPSSPCFLFLSVSTPCLMRYIYAIYSKFKVNILLSQPV